MNSLWTRAPTLAIGIIAEDGELSPQQRDALLHLLSTAPQTELHFGGGDGAEKQAAMMARACGLRLVAHRLLGARREPEARRVAPVDAEARGREIVDACGVLIVAPESRDVKSETAAAMRYARKLGRRTILLPY